MHLPVGSFYKYILSGHHVPGSYLSAEDTEVSSADQLVTLCSLHSNERGKTVSIYIIILYNFKFCCGLSCAPPQYSHVDTLSPIPQNVIVPQNLEMEPFKW